jgi:outer membrane protein OmpA-like peptidoglycan-associated protein
MYRAIPPRSTLRLAAVATAVAALASLAQEARATSCLSGPFFVFFDPGEDVITAKAQPILDNAASAYLGEVCGIGGRFVVKGHSDRSGSAAYNLSLSRRRAERVRAYLIERGLPGREIGLEAFGEDRPLVDTPDGVPHAENRRVEFTFTLPGW